MHHMGNEQHKEDPPAQQKRATGPRLTAKKRRFVDEYVACGEGAEAARRAGYASGRARNAAYKLMRDPLVSALVSEGQRALRTRAKYDADKAIADLDAAIGRARDAGNLNAELRALDQKARIVGLYIDQTVNKNLNANVDVADAASMHELTPLETARRLAFLLTKGAREAERNGDGEQLHHLVDSMDCGEAQRAERMRQAMRESGFQDPVALARVLPVAAPEPSDGWATQADDGAVLVMHRGKQKFRAASQSIAEAFIETERARLREAARVEDFVRAASAVRNQGA